MDGENGNTEVLLWESRVGLRLCYSNQSSSVSLCFTLSPPFSSLSTLLSPPPNASSDPLPSIPSSSLSSPIPPPMASTSTPFPPSAPPAPPLSSSQVRSCFQNSFIRFFLCSDRCSCVSDYWMVLNEIQVMLWNSSWRSSNLRYLAGNADSFGGNFSAEKRFSYFDDNISVPIPCGFLKKFPVTDSGTAKFGSDFFAFLSL